MNKNLIESAVSQIPYVVAHVKFHLQIVCVYFSLCLLFSEQFFFN
jgi:hypothetical protein